MQRYLSQRSQAFELELHALAGSQLLPFVCPGVYGYPGYVDKRWLSTGGSAENPIMHCVLK